MSEFKQYRRKGLSEMRPYVKGEDLSKISVSATDDPESDMGMVARNPKDHNDQWYVARKYFEDNLEEVANDAQNKNLNFGQALYALIEGKLVQRVGWNGKGMFIVKQIPATIGLDIIPKIQSLPQSIKDLLMSKKQPISYTNQMLIVNSEGRADAWVPSSSDCFAEDWQVL